MKERERERIMHLINKKWVFFFCLIKKKKEVNSPFIYIKKIKNKKSGL